MSSILFNNRNIMRSYKIVQGMYVLNVMTIAKPVNHQTKIVAYPVNPTNIYEMKNVTQNVQ